MKRQFEVPYNFSKQLIAFYAKHTADISYVFVPPYREDSLNTRSSIETHRRGTCYMSKSRAEYESHLVCLTQAGLRFVVLWQLPQAVITERVIAYYMGLGASGFIVGNHESASVIKRVNPELIVVCSLVQRVCYDVLVRDFSLYDFVLLYYPFNRGLDALKTLAPLKEKLILMPNTLCHVDCPSMHHWFPDPKRPFVQNRDCPGLHGTVWSGFIAPDHLTLFDDWVGGYKLQGREYTTDLIIYICSIYFNREPADELLDALLGEEQAKEMVAAREALTLEGYYNVKSQAILSKIRGLE